MIRVSQLLSLSLGAALLVAVAGCGGAAKQPRTITGKVVPPPNTKILETDTVNVTFTPDDKSGSAGIADVSKSDMTFTTKVPPGKYKVSFSITPYMGEKGSEQRTAAFDSLNKKFGASASPLSYEVTADPTQDVTVDLAQSKVSKN